MTDGNIAYPKYRERERAIKELVAKGAYTVIFMVLALIAIRPLMVTQILSRADAYSAFGLYDESKRQCNKVLLLDSDNGQAWYRLARIHKTQEKPDMALGAYQMATNADPTHIPAQFELGLMYMEDDRPQQAIPHFDQVRRLRSNKTTRGAQGKFPYHKSSLDMLLLCYEKVGDEAKAQFTREEMRVFYPHHVQTGEPVARTEMP